MSRHVAGWITAALLIGSADAQVAKPPDVEQKSKAGEQEKKQAKKPEDAPVQKWVDSHDLREQEEKVDQELYDQWKRERDSRPQRPDESVDARSDKVGRSKPKPDKAGVQPPQHSEELPLDRKKLSKQQRKRYEAWSRARAKSERERSQVQQQTRTDRREKLEKMRDELRQQRRESRAKHRQIGREEWQRLRDKREAKRNQRD